VQNEGAIVEALAATLDVKAQQIQIISITAIDAAQRRLQASETRSGGFMIDFTVDVVDEERITDVKDTMVHLVQAESEVQEAFVTELHSELKKRDAPMPAGTEFDTPRPKSANSETWLRGSTFFEQDVPSWIVADWNPCEGSCGTSYQNRSVECSSEDVTFCTAPKPPIFRECMHPTPCPDPSETCNFNCSPGWWIFFLLTLTVILCCLGCCLRVCSRRLLSNSNKKAIAKQNQLKMCAYAQSQANHSTQPDLRAHSNEVEAPTLLQSLPQEQVKSADMKELSAHASQHDAVKDVEAGIFLPSVQNVQASTTLPSISAAEIELQDEVGPSDGNVTDLVRWLTSVDMKQLKTPMPRGTESEVGDSKV
jgi:hypothetical protein